MDTAGALVQAYLQVNGYFTVTECPVVEALRHHGYRTVTDLDILAFHSPGAGWLVPGPSDIPPRPVEHYAPDPRLSAPAGSSDMIIGEV